MRRSLVGLQGILKLFMFLFRNCSLSSPCRNGGLHIHHDSSLAARYKANMFLNQVPKFRFDSTYIIVDQIGLWKDFPSNRRCLGQKIWKRSFFLIWLFHSAWDWSISKLNISSLKNRRISAETTNGKMRLYLRTTFTLYHVERHKHLFVGCGFQYIR